MSVVLRGRCRGRNDCFWAVTNFCHFPNLFYKLLLQSLNQSRTRSRASASPVNLHPFFLSLLHQLIALFRQCNLHEYTVGYVHTFMEVYQSWQISPFKRAITLAKQAAHGRGQQAMRIPQANSLFFQNIMRAVFDVDVPLLYVSLMEQRNNQHKELLKTLTPSSWLNSATGSVDEKSQPNQSELDEIQQWVHALHFQTAVRLDTPVRANLQVLPGEEASSPSKRHS
jgi:hypothetical protein